MTQIIVLLACDDGQTHGFTMAMQELRFVSIRELAAQILDQRTPKQTLDQILYVDDEGDRCTLSCEASMTDALSFCKQGALLLEIVADKHAVQLSPSEEEKGHTLIKKESICSEAECEVLYLGSQDVFATTDIVAGDQHLELHEETLEVSCNSISPAAAVTGAENQSLNLASLVQMDDEDALAAASVMSEESKVYQLVNLGFAEADARKALAEARDDVTTAAASLCGISELVCMGWSKNHAEIALAAAAGDVNAAAACLTSVTQLLASCDRELVMRMLTEREGDVESTSMVLRGICQQTQLHQENSVSQGGLTVTSSMELAIAELGLRLEKVGDTVISSASKAMSKIQMRLGKAVDAATVSQGFIKRRSRASRKQGTLSLRRLGAEHSASSVSQRY